MNFLGVCLLSFDIESREYNGRWFTSIRGWKVYKNNAAPAAGTPADFPAAPPVDFPPAPGEEDLPF